MTPPAAADVGFGAWLVGIEVAALVIAVLVLRPRALFGWYDVSPELLSNDPEREAWFQYFSTSDDYFGFDDATTSDWLLEEAKSQCAQKIEAIKAYEAKATTQFSIIGSGIGIVTVLGGSGLQRIPGHVWLVGIGVFFLFCSLVANIVCITRGRIDVLPYLDSYNYYKTLRYPRMKARIQHSLIEGYVILSNELAATCEQKQRVLAVATISFVLGLAVVVVNYLSAAGTQPPPTQVRLVATRTLGATMPVAAPQTEDQPRKSPAELIEIARSKQRPIAPESAPAK